MKLFFLIIFIIKLYNKKIKLILNYYLIKIYLFLFQYTYKKYDIKKWIIITVNKNIQFKYQINP